jgi:hypothetical protein
VGGIGRAENHWGNGEKKTVFLLENIIANDIKLFSFFSFASFLDVYFQVIFVREVQPLI